MKPISVSLSATMRKKLARISKESRLSRTTIIRHAVKKQLPLWEASGCGSVAPVGKIRRLKAGARE